MQIAGFCNFFVLLTKNPAKHSKTAQKAHGVPESPDRSRSGAGKWVSMRLCCVDLLRKRSSILAGMRPADNVYQTHSS